MGEGVALKKNSYQTNVRQESGGWRSTLKLPLFLDRDIHGLQIKCKIEDNIELSASAIININYAPVIQELPTKHLIINEGEPLTIRCKVDSNPRSAIYWKRSQGQKILKDYEVLLLKEVTKEDAG